MNRNVNRAEALWRNWEDNLQDLQSLPQLANADPMVIKRQQYDFLRMGLYRLSVDPAEHEKLLIQVVTSVKDKLQKQLYPNPLLRYLHRLKVAAFDQPRHLKKFAEQRAENLRTLKSELKDLGFAPINNRLENYLDYERANVSIPITSQLSGHARFEVSLHLRADAMGSYQFREFDAKICRPDGEHSFTFPTRSAITATEAANLLLGHAVRKPTESADGTVHHKWLQLDFSKDQAQMQEFHQGYGYDLKAELQKFGVHTAIPGLAGAELIRNLEAGNRTKFDVRDKGPYYLQADPAGRGLKIFDRDERPLELNKLLREIKPQQSRQPPALHLIKETSKEQDQSFGMGH